MMKKTCKCVIVVLSNLHASHLFMKFFPKAKVWIDIRRETSMQPSFYRTLGQKIKACRKAKGITLTELADTIHRSPASLSKYESGDVNIAIDALVEICTALNVDIAEFLPATYSDPDNVDILKYKKHFVDQLYIYWYSGDAKKVKSALIENSHPSMKSVLYFDTDTKHMEYQSDFIYHGEVTYSDTCIMFYYTNEEPPFDKIFIRMPLLFHKDHPQMGIMSCISLFYQGVTAKIMVSKKPLTFTPELTKELFISPEEIKELKRSNMLIIK